jgi:ADP-ribosylation factor-like protein 2
LRHAWDAYFAKTQGVIFVIDASEMNQEVILSSKMEFHNMLMHADLLQASILVFANKCDLPGSKDTEDLIELYNLNVSTHEV